MYSYLRHFDVMGVGRQFENDYQVSNVYVRNDKRSSRLQRHVGSQTIKRTNLKRKNRVYSI